MACCARAYRNGHQLNFNSDLWKKIELNAETFDLDGDFNTGTHKFIAPSTGYYQVNAACVFSPARNLGRYQLAVRKNGTAVCIAYNQHGDYVIGCNVSDIIYLRALEGMAPDYLELWAYQYNSVGGTTYIYGDSPYTFMSIVKLYGV